MYDRRSARAAGIALAVTVAASAAATAPGNADLAPADRLPPALATLEATCNAERAQARAEDTLHLVRLPAQDGSAGSWLLATPAGAANVESAASFRSGDFVTVVYDHAAIVRADLIHDDVTTGAVLAHDWCFIGGKLARATADVSFTTTAGADGYRRTRYYGDDLEHPLGETMLEKNDPNAPGGEKKFVPPAPAVDTILVTEPIARPAGLPFYDAVVAARAGRLPRLRK
jgi:hypothetical protein